MVHPPSSPGSRSVPAHVVALLTALAALLPSGQVRGQNSTGFTLRASVSGGGGEADDLSISPSLSADGRYVAFESAASNLVPGGGDTNGFVDIFVYDRATNTTERVSVTSNGAQSNENSYLPSISADGRYVAFESFAENLVGEDRNDAEDIFVRDRATARTERVSLG
ncbi:MAG: TolB family protein, partial [Actinomycetota bacterium]